MWFKRQYEIERDREHERSLYVAELTKLRTEDALLREALTREKANVDWLRLRCNQLELERSSLMMKVTGTFVPVPTITREYESKPGDVESFVDLAGMGIVGQNYDDPNDK